MLSVRTHTFRNVLSRCRAPFEEAGTLPDFCASFLVQVPNPRHDRWFHRGCIGKNCQGTESRLPFAKKFYSARIACAAHPSPAALLQFLGLPSISSFFRQEESSMAQEGVKWWGKETVAVVTGANKGIGYFIARRLAKEGITTVVTARNSHLGEEACKKLAGEVGVGENLVVFHPLDITKAESIDQFARWLEEQHGGADIVVNNAGMAYKGDAFGVEEARTTIATNYFGTRAVCEKLLPLLKPSSVGARIVNVSSSAGQLRIVGHNLKKKFDDPNITVEELDALVDDFISSIPDGSFKKKGWPASMYGVSKLAETTYTRILARQLAERPEGKRIWVNACCPGYCATDMSSWRGTKSADEGAETPAFLALTPPSHGGFFRDSRLVDF